MGAHVARLKIRKSAAIVPGCICFCVQVPACGSDAHGSPSPQVWRARESAWRTCLRMQLRDALTRGGPILARLPADLTVERVDADLA
jgi:hypothetical protein